MNVAASLRGLWPVRWLVPLSVAPVLVEGLAAFLSGETGWQSFSMIVVFVIAGLSVLVRYEFAWIVILLCNVQIVVPFDEPTSVFLPVLAALAILGTLGFRQGALSVSLVLIAYAPPLLQGGTPEMPIATILILFAFFVISSSLGIAWGVYQRQNSAEKLERSEAYRRRTLHLSDQLHNSVANDLVYLDHLILSSGHELDESLIIEARTTISEALGKVHQVIDEATFEAASDATNTKEQRKSLEAGKLVRQRLSDSDERMSNAGYIGTSLMGAQFDCSWLDVHSMEAVMTILEEIYGNILKHAQPKEGYCVALTENGERLEIQVADTPADQTEQSEHHGSGISRCRRLAGELHGTVTTSLHNHHWEMNIVIPRPSYDSLTLGTPGPRNQALTRDLHR
ncbi:MAG: hypothetical protein ACFWT0_02075 [Bifidobacterium crudilactis]|jgi:signal transduction histidine kinase